jgi:hypothetical protein
MLAVVIILSTASAQYRISFELILNHLRAGYRRNRYINQPGHLQLGLQVMLSQLPMLLAYFIAPKVWEFVRWRQCQRRRHFNFRLFNAAAPACSLSSELNWPCGSFHAARHNTLNQVVGHVKRGWTFAGVQNAQPSTGAGADIKQPAALLEGLSDQIDCFGNMRDLGCHRGCHSLILPVDNAQHPFGGFEVDSRRRWVAFLSHEMA